MCCAGALGGGLKSEQWMFHIRLHHHTTLQSIYAFILSQHPLPHLTSHPHNWKIPLTTRTQAMFWFWAMYQILPTLPFPQKNGCLCLRCFQSQIYFRTDWIDILLEMLTIYLYEVGIIRERVVMALATDVDRRVILHRFWTAPRYHLPRPHVALQATDDYSQFNKDWWLFALKAA